MQTKIEAIERRCDIKEQSIHVLEAWQNKAIGYAIAFSSVASIAVNYISNNL